MEKLLSIIEYIKRLIANKNFQVIHKTDRHSFTREPKISFKTVMLFVLGNTNSLLDFEILNFCEKQNISPFSKGAISLARQKVQFTAFRSILQTLSYLLPYDKLFKGYQLVGVDGTELQLPKSPAITEKYNNRKDHCNWPRAHVIAFYDVLNHIYLDAVFEPYETDERQAAISMLDESFIQKPQIYLMDRGFPSVGLIQKLNDSDKKFVFRVSKTFSKEVVAFRESNKVDSTINIVYNKSRTRTNRTSKDLRLPYCFDLRLVKISLKSGENEILITNLYSDDFTLEDIYMLYGLRWGIETSYNHIKNNILIEQWSCLLENSIKQDFYASLILFNLASLLQEDAQVEHDVKKNRIRELISMNIPLALVKQSQFYVPHC